MWDWVYGVSDCFVLSKSCRIDWNAWTTVSTAIAVILAAVALVFESRRATRIQQSEWSRADQLLRHEKDEKEQQRRHKATRIALVIDYELYTLGGTASHLQSEMTDEEIKKDPLGILRLIDNTIQDHEIQMRSFLPQIDVFEPALGAEIVRLHISIRNLLGPFSPETSIPEPALKAACYGKRAMLGKLIDRIVSVQDALWPYVEPFRKARIDFRDSATKTRKEMEALGVRAGQDP